jgi:hypothetical protein
MNALTTSVAQIDMHNSNSDVLTEYYPPGNIKNKRVKLVFFFFLI